MRAVSRPLAAWTPRRATLQQHKRGQTRRGGEQQAKAGGCLARSARAAPNAPFAPAILVGIALGGQQRQRLTPGGVQGQEGKVRVHGVLGTSGQRASGIARARWHMAGAMWVDGRRNALCTG
jgi:hypothetical protein